MWVRLDDNYADRPGIQAAGPLALALQVAAFCYCNRYLTDGIIPESKATQLINTDRLGVDGKQLVKQMLEHGLWEAVEGGYFISDYFENQMSREEALSKTEGKKTAGRKGGKASAQARAQAKTQASASADAQAELQAKSKPVPVPVPVPEEENVGLSAGAQARDEMAAASDSSVVPLRRAWKWTAPQLAPVLAAYRKVEFNRKPPDRLAEVALDAIDAGLSNELAAMIVGQNMPRARLPSVHPDHIGDIAAYVDEVFQALLATDPPVTTVEQYQQREADRQQHIESRGKRGDKRGKPSGVGAGADGRLPTAEAFRTDPYADLYVKAQSAGVPDMRQPGEPG